MQNHRHTFYSNPLCAGRAASGSCRESSVSGEANQDGQSGYFCNFMCIIAQIRFVWPVWFKQSAVLQSDQNTHTQNKPFICTWISFQASDMVSTSRILVAIVQMCYEAKDWDALNENIMLLSKRRSQLKQVRLDKALCTCLQQHTSLVSLVQEE